MNDHSLRGLIIIDGHPTRRNRAIWEHFSSINVDVICIPAHSSNILQPLDQTVNGLFKYYIQKTSFPKNIIQKDGNNFINLIYNCIYQCLCPSSIRKGFEKSLIVPTSNDTLLSNSISKFISTLPEDFETGYSISPTFFSISGKILTSKDFLNTWEEYENKKNEKKIEKNNKIKRKKKKAENNSDNSEQAHIIQEKMNTWLDESTIVKVEKEKYSDTEQELKDEDTLGEIYSVFENNMERKRLSKKSSKRKDFEFYEQYFLEIDENISKKVKRHDHIDDVDWKEFKTFNKKKRKVD